MSDDLVVYLKFKFLCVTHEKILKCKENLIDLGIVYQQKDYSVSEHCSFSSSTHISSCFVRFGILYTYVETQH